MPPTEHFDTTPQALKELGKLKPQAGKGALLEVALRKCSGGILFDHEDEPLSVGKGKTLRALRQTVDGDEFRLIYFHVKLRQKPKQGGSAKGKRDEVDVSTADRSRLVALLAWKKQRGKMPDHIRDSAWKRSERWLEANPDYMRA